MPGSPYYIYLFVFKRLFCELITFPQNAILIVHLFGSDYQDKPRYHNPRVGGSSPSSATNLFNELTETIASVPTYFCAWGTYGGQYLRIFVELAINGRLKISGSTTLAFHALPPPLGRLMSGCLSTTARQTT